jgi:hypothetical protein
MLEMRYLEFEDKRIIVKYIPETGIAHFKCNNTNYSGISGLLKDCFGIQCGNPKYVWTSINDVVEDLITCLES